MKKDFTKETVLDFGKHENKTIGELLNEEEFTYLYWLRENVANFSKDIEKELAWAEFENMELRKNFST